MDFNKMTGKKRKQNGRWPKPRTSKDNRSKVYATHQMSFESQIWQPFPHERRMPPNMHNMSHLYFLPNRNSRNFSMRARCVDRLQHDFRLPLPITETCSNDNRYLSSNQNFNTPRRYNYTPHASQQMSTPFRINNHRNIDNQIPLISECIPANHVKFPSPIMSHSSNSMRSSFRLLGHGSRNSNHYNRTLTRQPGWGSNQETWQKNKRLSLSWSNNRSENSYIQHRGKSRRRPFRGRRGGYASRGSRYNKRNSTVKTRPSPAPGRFTLRWRNNYRDIQRDIRNYIHIKYTKYDPLGLMDIHRENRRRDNLGLTPLRGDSAMNTPAYSLSTPVPNHEIDVSSLTPMLSGRIETPPQSNGLGAGIEIQSPSSHPTLNSEHYPMSGSDILERQPSDLSGVSGTDGQRHSRQEDEQSQQLQPPQTPQRQNEGSGGPAPQNLGVNEDRFHHRHRVRMFVSNQGSQRFLEETVYGNFHNYYTRRSFAVSESLFRPSIENRRCLDIGCNSGAITIELSKLSPESMLGIDIDGRLIQECRRNLAKEKRKERERRRGDLNYRQADLDAYLSNVEFQTGDYVPEDDRTYEPQYDTILALSVTKWIHLVNGDDGLRRFFRKVYGELREGGFFLLEPQPHRSYRKAYQEASHHNPSDLILRPPFIDYLRSIGFTLMNALDGRLDCYSFRDRNVYVFVKAAPEAISTSQLSRYPKPPPCLYLPSPLYRRLTSTNPSTSIDIPLTPTQVSPTGSYLYEAPGTSHATEHTFSENCSPNYANYSGMPPSPFEHERNRAGPVPGTSRGEQAMSPVYSDVVGVFDRFDRVMSPSRDSVESESRSPAVELEIEDSDYFPSNSPLPNLNRDRDYFETSPANDNILPRGLQDNEEPDENNDSPQPPASYVPLNYVFPPPSRQSSLEEGNSGAVSETSTSASQSNSAPDSRHQPIKMRLRRLMHGHPSGTDRWAVYSGGGMYYDVDDVTEDMDEDIDDVDQEDIEEDEEEKEDDGLDCDDVSLEQRYFPLAYVHTSDESNEFGSRSKSWTSSESRSGLGSESDS